MVSGYQRVGPDKRWEVLFTANLNFGNGATGEENFGIQDPDTGTITDPGSNALPFKYISPNDEVPQNSGYWTNISSPRGFTAAA